MSDQLSFASLEYAAKKKRGGSHEFTHSINAFLIDASWRQHGQLYMGVNSESAKALKVIHALLDGNKHDGTDRRASRLH